MVDSETKDQETLFSMKCRKRRLAEKIRRGEYGGVNMMYITHYVGTCIGALGVPSILSVPLYDAKARPPECPKVPSSGCKL
jgi:hypothetical protein